LLRTDFLAQESRRGSRRISANAERSVETTKLLSPEQVADLLGVSKQTLAVWRCEQRYPLAYVKVGSRVRYRSTDVDRFLTSRLQTQSQL
jgi:excisionase family DNA binding protein